MAESGIDPPSHPVAAQFALGIAIAVVLSDGRATDAPPILAPSTSLFPSTSFAPAFRCLQPSHADPTSP